MAYFIGITGGSGAGKTFLTNYLSDFFYGKVSVLSYDRYYRDLSHLPIEEAAKTNFDMPKSYESELLIKHIEMLKKGKEIEVPIYYFPTYSRLDKTTPLAPNDVVIVEGIMLFSVPEVLSLMDYKIYIDADADVRLARRLLRDHKERGYSYEGIIDRYISTVKPMHNIYIEPKKQLADFVFTNNDNNGVEILQVHELIDDMEKKGLSVKHKKTVFKK